MNSKLKMNLATLVVLSAAVSHAFAESADVRVTGTISPAACSLALGGGGTIDYGTIHPDDLSEDNYTLLDEKEIDFAITCDAPAKIAVRAKNGRPGTLAGAPEFDTNGGMSPVTLFGSFTAAAAGLGLDGSTKIGGYGVRISQESVLADGNVVNSISRQRVNGTWDGAPTGDLFSGSLNSRLNTWAQSGSTEPAAFTSVAGKVGVQAYINHASELDLSKPIALDGLTTLELVYL